MNTTEIISYLPHRYPMLLIDKVLEVVPEKSIKVLKNVTANEEFFVGHFPQDPIMPGVLIIESIAQGAGILAMKTLEYQGREAKGKKVYFTGIDAVKFRGMVKPGDTMIHHIELVRYKLGICKFSARTFVEDKLVAEAEISAMIDLK